MCFFFLLTKERKQPLCEENPRLQQLVVRRGVVRTGMLVELSNMIKPLMKILLKDKDKVNEFLKQLLSTENNTINQIEIEIQTDSSLLEYYTQVWTTEVFNKKRGLLHKKVYDIKQLQKPYLLKQYEGNQEELFQIMKDNDNWEEIVELMYGF